jgi:hypothetical protein
VASAFLKVQTMPLRILSSPILANGFAFNLACFTRHGFNPPQMNESPSLHLAERMAAAFPAVGRIPAEFRLDTRSYERLFLIDGKLREWTVKGVGQ